MAEGDGVPRQKSDLPARIMSAIVMVAVAGAALWAGGWLWAGFVTLVGLGVLIEWTRLFLAFAQGFMARLAWALGGAIYVSVATLTLVLMRHDSAIEALFPVGLVIATDVGAYFTGRSFGGPKIAPRISPSKTWSGLVGGMVASGLVATLPALVWGHARFPKLIALLFGVGMVAAVCAQAGDFFESWMKRRAGVKDSGRLIPGHGGLFDRVDGLLAVCFIIGLLMLGTVFLALVRGESLLPSPA